MQVDLHRNPRGGTYPLLLDIQADLLASLATRAVVPLTTRKRHGARVITRLNPIVAVGGIDDVLVFQELSAVPTSALGAVVGSMAARRAEIVAAIDLLFAGV